MATRIYTHHDPLTGAYAAELFTVNPDGFPVRVYLSEAHSCEEDAILEIQALEERETDGPVQDFSPDVEPWWCAVDQGALAASALPSFGATVPSVSPAGMAWTGD